MPCIEVNTSLGCFMTDDGLVVTVTDREPFAVTDGIDEFCAVIYGLMIYKDYDDAYEHINKTNYISKRNYLDICDLLKRENIIKENDGTVSNYLTEYQNEKYSRQICSFSTMSNINTGKAKEIQEKLLNSKICIVGIGGTGSHLALNLAAMGIQNLILVDFDHIELSNTSRQILYDESNIGQNKLEVAKAKLLNYNKNLNVTLYNRYIQTVDDFSFLEKHTDIDLLVQCADTPRGEILYLTDQAMEHYKVPWFAFGPYHHSQVVVGPLIIPGQTASYNELFPRAALYSNDIIDKINSNFIASICEPFNAISANVATIEVLKYLSNNPHLTILNKRIYMDTDKWEITINEF